MKKVILYIVIILLIVAQFHQWRNHKNKENTFKVNQLALLDTVSYYKNKNGLLIAEKRTFQGTEKELRVILNTAKAKNKQLRETVKKFKKLENASSVNQTIKIDAVDIPFDKKVSVNFVRKFFKKTDYYTFSGEVNQLGININFLSTNLQTQATGVKRLGWLSSEYRTEISNSNPFITTTNFDNFNFVKKKTRFGVSIFGGYALTSNFQFTPAIGFGVSYDLFRF